jgi:hypothetical protein
MNIKVNRPNSNHEKNDLFFLIALLSGYIIVCALPSIFRVESRDFAVPYRFFMFFLSLYILSNNLYYRKLELKTVFIFFTFWIYYFFKTRYSFATDYYLPQFIGQEFEVYLRIFIINLFPCFALFSIDYSKVDFKCLIISFFWIVFIMLIINLLYTVFYLNKFNNVSGIFSVYYISSGHFGASLIILCSYLLLFNASSENIINKNILLSAIVLGLFAIYISAARGPILALIVVGLYYIVLKKKVKFLFIFLFFLVVFITLIYISRQFFHLESAFIERNYLWIFEGNTSGREPYFNRAIAIFKDNILVGGRVLYEDGMYPHNLFLELLMSGGILLLLIFGLIFYPLIKNINYFLNVSNSKLYILPLFALWLQYLILVQTSYNIHSNPEFWYFSSVIIGISIKNHNEKT